MHGPGPEVASAGIGEFEGIELVHQGAEKHQDGENDIAQFKYLSDHFTTEAIFTKQDEINHRDYMTYNIAVKYGDYKLAAQKLAGNPFVKKAKKSLFYKVKIFFSSNSFLFYIWVIMSKLYKKIDLRLFE